MEKVNCLVAASQHGGTSVAEVPPNGYPASFINLIIRGRAIVFTITVVNNSLSFHADIFDRNVHEWLTR